MRIGYLIAGVLGAALVLAGCGGGGETADGAAGRPAASTQVETSEGPPPVECPPPSKQLRVTLDGYMGAENAGLLMAKRRGYFGDLGLHVWLGSPSSPESPASYVSSGVDDIGVTQQPQLVLAKELSEPIVAIGSVIDQPTAAMIWLPGSGIEDVADLEGKTIAIPSFYPQEDLLKAVLAEAGIDSKQVRIVVGGYELVPKLLKGKVDAIFGGSPNMEGAALRARGADPVVTPVQELGVPAYDELVVIAREKCLARYPSMYRRFMSAVARGTDAAVADPQGTLRLIELSIERDPKGTHRQIEAQVDATLPLLSKDSHLDPEQASQLIDWMHEKGMIQQKPAVAQLFSNDYLTP
jgi:putative hydroxymethylpyrimidine transport system substrate-binding protein